MHKNIFQININTDVLTRLRDKINEEHYISYIKEFYDKNKKKIISQESFIKNIKISKSNILKAINESLDNYLMNYPHYDETFTQYKVYYITNGDLVVSYKLPDVNSYSVATLKTAS